MKQRTTKCQQAIFLENLQQAKAFLTDQRRILSVMVGQEGKIVMTWDNTEVSLSDVEKIE